MLRRKLVNDSASLFVSGVGPVRRASTFSASSVAEWRDWDRRFVIHPYSSLTEPRTCLPVRAAEGCHIELEDGKKLVDGISSWWSAVHGYRHPKLDAAVREQLESMAHIMFGGLAHRSAAQLCKRLSESAKDRLNMDSARVFLADSGSVSVEVAMKLAVQYWHGLSQPNKSRFLTIRNGYHGDTFGAMSVCDPSGMHALFGKVLTKQLFVDAPKGASLSEALACAERLEHVLAENKKEIAAIIIEPVLQGAGGLTVYHPELLSRIQQMCADHDVLFIVDEIATGFWRTGKYFASEHTASSFRGWYWESNKENSSCCDTGAVDTRSIPLSPDIVCLGKALTGGYMTMGAAVVSGRVCQGVSGKGGVFMHGPTFMANPLACAVATASLELLDDPRCKDRLERVHRWLRAGLARLSDLPAVHSVRVIGAVGVCELKEPLKDLDSFQRIMLDRGVWLRPFGRTLYTMPQFNCPGVDEEIVRKISDALYALAENEGRATLSQGANKSFV